MDCPTSTSPIAICGIGLRLAGGVRSTADFWDLLVTGRDARAPVPHRSYASESFDDSLGGKAVSSKFGYFLDDDLSQFDASSFSMSQKEAERCDPQQRLLLEVVRECLEDAGETDYRGKHIGCYVGTFGEEWLHIQNKDSQQIGLHHVGGNGDWMISNRVSYEYDLRGPSMVIRTACSASLTALHEACRALNNGDASASLVAGTNLIMTPTNSELMSAAGLLSPEGSCKSFDARADGFARAEGITVLYIKRLEDAIRDGNIIRAVIRGTATNSNGKSDGLLTPRVETQEALMKKVYADAGLQPSETAFVECHGTGTAVGDPIEATAVGNVFGEHGVYIGSVKPNIGHCEGSAGLASLIKGVLALEHRTIPPNIKFEIPNPKIPFMEKRLIVPTEPKPFPANKLERVSINSFGIGGANAHVILESYRKEQGIVRNIERENSPQLILLSADNRVSLESQIRAHQQYALNHPANLFDMAYTRALRREQLTYSAFLVMGFNEILGTSEVVSTPTKRASSHVVMVFTGQGSQWPGMGKELLTNKQFHDDIVLMDEILQSLPEPPEWSIQSELLRPEESSRLYEAELSQPLCTALQIAIYHQYKAIGVDPAAVVGHSSGEIAAAYAAGRITLADALKTSYFRGLVVSSLDGEGTMAAIGLDASEVEALLPDGVVVACLNSPQSTTIAGDRSKIENFVAFMNSSRPSILARVLKVDRAYHSHYMTPHAIRYRDALEHLQLSQNAISENEVLFVSGTTGEVIEDITAFGPDYWVNNLISPVRFNSAVNTLLTARGGDDIFLEIGPHGALAGPLRQILEANQRKVRYISSQKRGENSSVSLLKSIGRLYQENVKLDLRPMFPEGEMIQGLPLYPWDHTAHSLWIESRVSTAWRQRKYPHHSILGRRSIESPDTEPSWRNILQIDDVPWLTDHKVGKDVVFPFACYVAMAGEAIRQIAGADMNSGYRLRDVIASTALVLDESKSVEIVTSLRQGRLTDSDESQWFEFTISSHNGSNWTKHCFGKVGPAAESIERLKIPSSFPRKLAAERFYGAMRRAGFSYGPEFQSLTAISSASSERTALANLIDREESKISPYILDPTAIDGVLQLLLIAKANGFCRNMNRLYVPTKIDEMTIHHGTRKMKAVAQISGIDLTSCEAQIVDGEHVVLDLRGLHISPVEQDEAEDNIHALARLTWLPDFDFIDISALIHRPTQSSAKDMIKLQKELTLLCMLKGLGRLGVQEPCQPHLAKFRRWLEIQIQQAKEGVFPRLSHEETTILYSLDPGRRDALIEVLIAHLVKSEGRALALGTRLICDHIEGVFNGTEDPLELLTRENLLTQIYQNVSFDYSAFVEVLCNSRPTLRILEVGAGTGGTTERILLGLKNHGMLPKYGKYTFTDISAGFFPSARERFSQFANIEFKTLDVSRSPQEQDFESDSYDLIIAANVIHATPSIQKSLKHLRALLKPEGFLVLTEALPGLASANYVFGHLPGWWLGEHDNRPLEPLMSVERWDSELKAAGFSGSETVVYDDELNFAEFATIISQPKIAAPAARSIALLCKNPESYVAQELQGILVQNGWNVMPYSLESTIPVDLDIVSCLHLEGKGFSGQNEQSFIEFQTFISKHGIQRTLWLLTPFQIECSEPDNAVFLGAVRALRGELGIPLHTLEIAASEPRLGEIVLGVLEKIYRQDDAGVLAPDMEYAVADSQVFVPRYQPFLLHDQLSHGNTSATAGSAYRQVLQMRKTGLLDTFYWNEELVPSQIPDDHIEIEVRASGVNFHDLLIVKGLFDHETSSGNLEIGLESSGVIRRVGALVKEFSPGDRVMTVAQTGLVTTAVVPAELVIGIPDEMTFEAASTIPTVFSTVLYSLINIGRLEKGQSVLIHSACGGVGLAAIQVCKMLGVEVFATVGSQKKIDYLVREVGIPRSRIFSSRDSSFVRDVMRETGGCGVDLVLNSLSGELLHESWSCVADFGTMVELGRRDLSGSGKLDLKPFLGNRSYTGVNMEHFQQRPRLLGSLLKTFMQYHRQGQLRPLDIIAAFSARDVVEAYRFLEDRDHMGKVVITFSPTEAEKETVSVPAVRHLQLDNSATYLLVGGTGGLGRSIATWLVEHGARNLIFLSRSAGQSDASKSLFVELESMGCCVRVVAGRVDNLDDIHRVVAEAQSPIKGVLQLAMELNDAPMLDMEWSQWSDTQNPKVRGTWNLHHALQDFDLDFFFLSSSVISSFDLDGQGNYAAANTFLEAFCQYRHSLGLPASVLNICPITDVGFVAENPHASRTTTERGLYSLGEREFLETLELCLLDNGITVSRSTQGNTPRQGWVNESQIIMGLRSIGDLSDPQTRTSWRRDRRMGFYHNVRNQAVVQTHENNPLQEFLSHIAADAGKTTSADSHNAEFLACQIGRKIYDLLLKPDKDVNIDLTLTEAGLDSLLAIELSRWFKSVLGVPVSVLEIVASGTLRKLGAIASEKLSDKFHA